MSINWVTDHRTAKEQQQFSIFDSMIRHLTSLHPPPHSSEYINMTGRLFESDDKTWHLQMELIMTEGDGEVQVAATYRPLDKTFLLHWSRLECMGEVAEYLTTQIDRAIKECWDHYLKNRCAYY